MCEPGLTATTPKIVCFLQTSKVYLRIHEKQIISENKVE
jgi:hypothetical protein